MLAPRLISPTPSRWRVFLSALCMALVMVAGTVSVAHSHRDSNALEHGTCGLCVTAHAVAQVATPSAQIAVALVFEPLAERAPIARTRTFSGTAHVTRPPPATHLS